MKFYNLNEIPARNDDRVFKASSKGALIWFLFFSSVGIALILFAVFGRRQFGPNLPPAIFTYGGAAFFGLFSWMTFRQLQASLKPANWLLRCNDAGVIIKYRSFFNWRFPESDVQAVALDYAEIASARIVKERRTSPALGAARNNTTRAITFLELCLANADNSSLEAHLQAEQNIKPQGLVNTLDYPVEISPGGIIRLRWKTSDGYGISPSADQALQYLSGRVKILAPESTKVNLTHDCNRTPGQEDAKILALARSGDPMGAVQLTQEVYRSSLSEAVTFVEKLQSGK
jgi:hypothetical protein